MKNDGLRGIREGSLPLHEKDCWGTALRPKGGGPSGEGNGDGILIDCSCGLFAVSDSSDRNPAFSRDFLHRLADRVRDIPDAVSDRVLDSRACRDFMARVQQASADVLQDVLSSGSCTLTGMILVKTEQGLRGLLVHTGDSLLYLYDGSNVRQISRTNFWMAGRTTRLFQVEYIPFATKSRLLFATDGLSCLRHDPGETKESLIGRLFKDYPAGMAAERLMDICVAQNGLQDDLAVISLNPSEFARREGSLVLEGSGQTPLPVADYRKDISAPDDGWSFSEAPEFRFLLRTP